MHRPLLALLGPILLALAAMPGCGDGRSSNGGTDLSSDAGTDLGSDMGDDVVPDVGAPLPELAFEEVSWADPPVAVTKFRFLPGSGDDLLLTAQGGTVHHYRLDRANDELVEIGSFQVPDVHLEWDCGLISLAIDPDFENNGFIYLGYCTSTTTSGVFRYRIDLSDLSGAADTGVTVIEVGDSAATLPYHNVGDMGFDEEGRLWVAFGDKYRGANAQDVTNNLGALLRIVPSRGAGGGYEAASDNPFFGVEDGPQRSDDILAYGLRSPWTVARDASGRYFIGDVGNDSWEEIDMLGRETGVSFGWPVREGRECVGRSSCAEHTLPLVVWDHEFDSPYFADDPEAVPTAARLAFVGFAYDFDAEDPYAGRLTNRVVYGDMCLGFLRALEVDEEGDVVLDGHVGHLANATSWDRDAEGVVYASTYGACESPRGAPLPPSRFWRVVLSPD